MVGAGVVVVVVVVVVAVCFTVLAEVATLFKAMISTTAKRSSDPKCIARRLATSVLAIQEMISLLNVDIALR